MHMIRVSTIETRGLNISLDLSRFKAEESERKRQTDGCRAKRARERHKQTGVGVSCESLCQDRKSFEEAMASFNQNYSFIYLNLASITLKLRHLFFFHCSYNNNQCFYHFYSFGKAAVCQKMKNE